MGKTRVGVRLKDAVGANKSHYRSEDLKSLTERYNGFVKKLKQLVNVLKAHNDAQLHFVQSRLAVANHLAEMSRDSPISQHVGAAVGIPDSKGKKDSNAPPASTGTDYSASVNEGNGESYMSIHATAERKASLYASKYKQHVIDYVVEWEKVITTRITNGLKKWEEVRVETDHYHKKVESLRQSANSAMSKGKQVDAKSADKLTRNEEKWIQAKQTHQKVTTDLCILIDEIVNRCWRDLHPLLIKLAQFDITTSEDASASMQLLKGVVANLKSMAATHNIKPQARLSDLQSLDPNLLNTRPEGQPIPGSNGALAIESSMGNLSIDNAGLGDPFSPASHASSSSLDGSGFGMASGAIPNGYSAPLPVQRVTSNVSRSSSMGSFSSASGLYGQPAAQPPSTLDMLGMQNNAAPAPTMDQLHGAGMMVPHTGPSMNTGYNNYGVPQAQPQPIGNRSRNTSLDGSFSSDYSSGLAPPPMSAPPPPPPAVQTDPFAHSYSAQAHNSTNPFGAQSPTPANSNNNNNNSSNTSNMYSQYYASTNGQGQPPRPPTQPGYARRSSNPFDM